MEIRPLGPGAIATLHRLFAAALPHDSFSPELLREKLFDNPRPATDTFELLAAFDEDFLAGAMQSIARPKESRAWLGLFATHAEFRRRGVAARLLGDLLDRWRRDGIREVEVLAYPGNTFAPGLDPRLTAAFCFLERSGFRRFKENTNLIVDLSEVIETTADDGEARRRGFELRKLEAADAPRLDEFFGRVFGADWRLEAARAQVHAAFKAGRIVAFAAHSGQNREWGWFGPMGTAPEAEGQGLGRALLRRCLADLRADGHKTAVIPWVGPIAFYARHAGARVDRVFWRMKLVL
jgi:GNAT superfamily N-acetyltransferase